MKFTLPSDDKYNHPRLFKAKYPKRIVYMHSSSWQPPGKDSVIFNTHYLWDYDEDTIISFTSFIEDTRVELKEDSVLFYVYPGRFVSFCMLQKKTLSSDLIRQFTTYM